MSNSIKQLVRDCKRKRKNRAYYDSYYNIQDIRQAGLVQAEEKTLIERVQLAEDTNELVYLFGLDQDQRGSRFELLLSVVSLFPNGSANRESRYRLASVDFKLVLQNKQTDKQTTYSYNQEQLLDYHEKRQNAGKHEHRNIYKVGSITIEQVLPFSFARILFNGLMQVIEADGSSRHEPMRLSISTHPTCDKFDYQYRFNVGHTANMVAKSLNKQQMKDNHKLELVEQVLEDRFDQPLMFQGQLESLAPERSDLDEQFVLWGAKVKKFIDPRKDWTQGLGDERDCLFAWTECGQQIHLTRPTKRPSLIYGMIHSSYDYASSLYDAKLYKDEVGEEKEIDFAELDSFNELAGSYKIKLRAFKRKWFTLEIGQNEFISISELPVFKVKINGFDGLAMRRRLDLASQLCQAQAKLLTLNISDPLFGFPLAEERLLGGKGNSLVYLAQLVRGKRLAETQFSPQSRVNVSVPRGLVVTTRAYELWLRSSSKLCDAIASLDTTRRSLAAKSVHLNPMSKEYLSLSSSQKILRAKSDETCAILRSVGLPNQLKAHLYQELVQIFGKEQLQDRADKLFAVRSSAVGEDSMETSAAGQMRTILDARGFQSICQAVVECWSSQFELEAVTYKSQNGLTFNLPMAVVVQELVPCYAAGVAATCDPLTGNAQRLEITANFGLGEGVVAGKRTDTIRVSLEELGWRALGEDFKAPGLELPRHVDRIEKVKQDDELECCLSNEQIVSLANLLIELRRASAIREREVEWGVTLCGGGGDSPTGSSSSSSSSASSASSSEVNFRLHLLQSRPLTHLQRLTTREIDHEQDYGFPCARDVVSRANLGEVMPGALCPLNSSYVMPIQSSYATKKPFEANHSRKLYVADSFAFYANMAMMVVTYTDTLKRFTRLDDQDQTMAKAVIYSMIGSTSDEPKTEEERQFARKFQEEKINPLACEVQRGLFHILATDAGLLALQLNKIRRSLAKTVLQDDLPALDQTSSDLPTVHKQIRLLYKRLTSNLGPFSATWMGHIQATLLSMAFNVICLKLMVRQPAYAGKDIIATEILNDFSVLMREPKPQATKVKLGKQTESGDISKLLSLLLACLVEENLLDKVKAMKPQELYDFFTNDNGQDDGGNQNLKCRQLFRDFMQRNGHRAYREFCLSTITWADDSSYIMRLLAMRLKTYTREEAEREERKRVEMEREHAQKYDQVVAKITSARFALMGWALPRARHATVRREGSKSLLIRANNKYRLAFRHLGGLLCLAGLLPSADLIFYLSIEELDEIITGCCADNSSSSERDSLMPRLLYKARRRQQRARAYDNVKFPKPNLTLNEMFASIREQTSPQQSAGQLIEVASENANGYDGQDATGDGRVQVKGLISCNGLATGRACVIASIDDVDQIEQGDILITYSIDISWSVYFFALAGIVTEVGGIVSHGAVVAREYGIPTLCTAIDACKKFKTGQIVTLDANRGVCYLAIDEGAKNNGATSNKH